MSIGFPFDSDSSQGFFLMRFFFTSVTALFLIKDIDILYAYVFMNKLIDS